MTGSYKVPFSSRVLYNALELSTKAVSFFSSPRVVASQKALTFGMMRKGRGKMD